MTQTKYNITNEERKRRSKVLKDRWRKGAMPTGEGSGNSTLTEVQVVEIKDQLMKGVTCTNLANSYGVSVVTINDILHGKTWKYLSTKRDISKMKDMSKAISNKNILKAVDLIIKGVKLIDISKLLSVDYNTISCIKRGLIYRSIVTDEMVIAMSEVNVIKAKVRLTKEQKEEIQQQLIEGISYKDLVAKYNVDRSTISRINTAMKISG